jgi:hypothetical protein
MEPEGNPTRGGFCELNPNHKICLLPALELKFKWLGQIDLIPSNGKVLIKVPRTRDLDRTTLDVIDKYAERLMHNLKHFMYPKVRKALEYYLKREIVMKLDEKLYPESHSLLNKFYDETLASIQTDNNINFVYDLEEITKRGLLEVLLTVYAELGEKIHGYTPREDMLKETLNIFNFILRIASKGREDVCLVHKGTINFVIVLIDIKFDGSFQHYVKHIQDYANKGIEMIFILGAGFINQKATKIIAENFVRKNNNWTMMFPVENQILSLTGKKIKSTCILLKKKITNDTPNNN